MRVLSSTARGGWTLYGWLAIAMIGFALIPSGARAAAPANDEISAASTIEALPFSDTLNTTDATTADDDPYCAASAHTVWYAYTPSVDMRVDANTFGSSYDTTISAYTGSAGALTQIACNDDNLGLQSQIVFDASAGQTYYIMAGSFGGSAGGDLTLTLREAPPRPPAPELELSIDRGGSIDRNGPATVSGTITCNQPMFVNLFGSLTQTFAHRFTIAGFGGSAVSCTPPEAPWKLTLFSFNNRYSPGPARASINAFACNAVNCAFDQQAADVVLRAGRPQ